jgi:hypothetical protein
MLSPDLSEGSCSSDGYVDHAAFNLLLLTAVRARWRPSKVPERRVRWVHLARFNVSFRGLGQGSAITHHVDPPCGLEGGGHGVSGLYLWIREDPITDEERVINLGGKTAKFGVVDGIIIRTRGCGGYGAADRKDCKLKR